MAPSSVSTAPRPSMRRSASSSGRWRKVIVEMPTTSRPRVVMVSFSSLTSGDVRAAVDAVGDAGDVGGVLAGEPHEQGGDLLRSGLAPERHGRCERPLGVVVAADADVCVDDAGGDGVDGDAVLGELARHATGQP